MISMTAQIDGAASEMMQRALSDYGRAMGDACGKAPKIAALQVCDSLKARTRKSPKRAPAKEVQMAQSPNPPHYITYRRGVKLNPPLHRWSLTRKLGTPAQSTHDYFVYCHVKAGKKGGIVKDLAAEKRELRKYHLGIFHAGLAKASWGWAKKEIHSGSSEDVVWKRRKRDRRDPKRDVNGSYRREAGMTTAGGRAEIHNHLDYINNALAPMALNDAIRAAAAKIAFKAAKAQHMTPEEAAQYARDLASSYAT